MATNREKTFVPVNGRYGRKAVTGAGNLTVRLSVDRTPGTEAHAGASKDSPSCRQCLNARGIGFRSLTEQIDTTTSGGKLIFHVFGALAEFERDVIRERTQAGLAAARARGRMGGRPKKLATPTKVAMARGLYADKSHTVAEICTSLGISRATLYRYVTPARSAPSSDKER
jgi:DNA invertase Pin-like site-specific DNA recombinase